MRLGKFVSGLRRSVDRLISDDAKLDGTLGISGRRVDLEIQSSGATTTQQRHHMQSEAFLAFFTKLSKQSAAFFRLDARAVWCHCNATEVYY